jgi:hypothetical protein
MALTFPNNPTINDIYQPSGSAASYYWTGTYWAIRQSANPIFNKAASGSIFQVDSAGYPVPSTIVIANNQLTVTASSAVSASQSISSSFAATASAVNTLQQDIVWVANKLRVGASSKAPWATGSISLGHNNDVSGSYSVIMGSNNFISESAPYSFVHGQYNLASAAFQTIVGQWNALVPSQSVFVVGTGDEANRRNVAEFYTGRVILSGSLTVFNSASNIELQVTDTGIKLGNLLTDRHQLTGSLFVTGSIIGTSSFAITASNLSSNFTPYYIQAGNSSAQTIPSNSATRLTGWTTTFVSTGSAWNETAGTFTCQRAGWYRLRASVSYAQVTGSVGNEFNVIVGVNGANSYTAWTFKQVHNNIIIAPPPVDSIHYLDVDDIVEVKTYQDSGAPQSLSGRVDINLITIQELPNFITK